jgi:hypothetical protein
VQMRRRADVYDVDVVHAADFIEIGRDAADAVLLGDVLGASAIDVANRHNLEAVGDLLVGVDVRSANAHADNTDA